MYIHYFTAECLDWPIRI